MLICVCIVLFVFLLCTDRKLLAYPVAMKDWLDNQTKIEKDVLDAVSEQTRAIADDLLPQIRLAALENEMRATIQMEINFSFEDEATDIWSEGSVTFPPRHSATDSIRL